MLLSLGSLSSEPSCLRGKGVCRMGRQWICSLFARVVFALGAPCLASLRAGDSCEGCYLMSHLRTTCCPAKTDQALCPHRLLQSGWKRLFRLAFPPGGVASSRLCHDAVLLWHRSSIFARLSSSIEMQQGPTGLG